MKVTGDTGVCVGSGQCVLRLPEVFDQRERCLAMIPAVR